MLTCTHAHMMAWCYHDKVLKQSMIDTDGVWVPLPCQYIPLECMRVCMSKSAELSKSAQNEQIRVRGEMAMPPNDARTPKQFHSGHGFLQFSGFMNAAKYSTNLFMLVIKLVYLSSWTLS